MTIRQQNENPLNIKAGTKKIIIYTEYFVKGNQDKQDIANKAGTVLNNVITSISYMKKKLAELSTGASVQNQSPVGTQVATRNAGRNSNSNIFNAIEVKIFEENNELKLFVKTCPQFEKWLKEKKEVRESSNLWNQRVSGKFYYLQISDNYRLDDINSPIITNRFINFAVLRVVGISEGVKFKIDGLLPKETLVTATRKLISEFKNFYETKVLNQKIDIEASVEVEAN